MAMASKLGEVFVAITGKDMGLKAALGKAEMETSTAAGKMTMSIGNVAATMGKVFLALGAAEIVKKGIEGAEKYEERQTQLVSALSATGDATKRNVEHLKDYAAALSKQTIYSKGAIIEAIAQGKAYGVQTSQLDDVTKAAIGLAARFKMDLPAAMQMMARASQGNFREIQRWIPKIKEAGDESKKFGMALKEGMDSFHYATAQASTTSGKFQQFNNRLNSIITTIGIALAPILDVLVSVLRPIADLMAGLGTGFWKWVAGIAASVAIIIQIIKVVAQWKKIQEGVAAAIAATKAAAGDWKSVAAAIAAVAGITVAFATASAASNDNLDKLMDDYARSAADRQAQAEDTLNRINAANDKATDKGKADAENKAEELFNKKRDLLKEQAQKLLDVAKATREAREEEQKRRESSIGWIGAEEAWKQAAVVGERQRFWHRTYDMVSPFNSQGFEAAHQARFPNDQFSIRELRDAMAKLAFEMSVQTKYLAQATRYLDPRAEIYGL